MVSSRPIWLSQLCSLVLATLKSFPIIKPCPCPLILWSKEMTLQKPVEAKCRKRQQEAAAASFLLLSSIFSISDFIFDAWFYIWFWFYIWCLIWERIWRSHLSALCPRKVESAHCVQNGFPFIPTIVPPDHSSPLPGAWLGNPEICCRCCCTVTKAAAKTAFSPDCKTAKL